MIFKIYSAIGLEIEKFQLGGLCQLINPIMEIDREIRVIKLTVDIARSFVEKIIIHEPIFKEGSKRIRLSQEIHIYFNYIGEFNNE